MPWNSPFSRPICSARERHQKAWRRKIAFLAGCRVVQVESDAVIPIEVVSNKAEYTARTIRPKIHKHLKVVSRYLLLETRPYHVCFLNFGSIVGLSKTRNRATAGQIEE